MLSDQGKGKTDEWGRERKDSTTRQKAYEKSNIKDRIDFIYCQIGKVNLDTLCAHLLLRYMIIKKTCMAVGLIQM